eukprot:3433972-Rhodomonas_salina.1
MTIFLLLVLLLRSGILVSQLYYAPSCFSSACAGYAWPEMHCEVGGGRGKWADGVCVRGKGEEATA